ncbi:tetratricopeptide repeat protein 1-like [Apostichopus japonicus]|uniref:tetratricopeptide repeat protein 1-like n=1 Tax=Stichopus japonicus TaxID=307972 RepID=UPI003AB4C262
MASKPEASEDENSSSEDEFYDTLSELSKEAEKAKDMPTTDSLSDDSLVENLKAVENQANSDRVKEITVGMSDDHESEDLKEQVVCQSNEANENTSTTSDLVNDRDVVNLQTGESENVAETVDEDGCSSCSDEDRDKVIDGDKVQINEGLASEAAEHEESQEEVDNGAPKEEDPDGEEVLRELEDTLSEEEKEERKEQAQVLKKEGNDLYKLEEYPDAIHKYTEAVKLCPLSFKKERSIMFANRAACKIHLKQLEEGVKDCSKALDLHPHYIKVLLRRAQTYELLEKLDEALADYQRALEMDPGCHIARAACMRLPGEINERNEKLKAEMMDKLKDLGNMVLRPFGLSTDNFKVQQDPNTGSYSMNFMQNNKTNGN